MRIILTHEQADFDALASLLGARLVDDTSIPSRAVQTAMCAF
jgi:nanoRNase/pAp phosphatase (c-di-AMP/oligoRNAs hydrolase)